MLILQEPQMIWQTYPFPLFWGYRDDPNKLTLTVAIAFWFSMPLKRAAIETFSKI